MKPLEITPIGLYFEKEETQKSSKARQSILQASSGGWIELTQTPELEQALSDVEGFSHLWILFWMDQTGRRWKPKVLPPVGSDIKRGVFSTRSPYRPNPIGLSCVEFVGKEKNILYLGANDLLAGSPILDIKPYLAYADSVPQASFGWTTPPEANRLHIELTALAQEQLEWLKAHQFSSFSSALQTQLEFEPTAVNKKRVKHVEGQTWIFSYRTWRASFEYFENERKVKILKIFSGYQRKDFEASADPFEDLELHKKFLSFFDIK
ncbi:MAG: tRNA (N6-threonylcarbamoyladenosine(37)-N6)-methyltransferase TrmO [Proteobacteria bacterium]|jgi:tRNA-Thr(GGU) m(6)t(6)A37 methyltransferase TsaA|nr:tRNA (N6-threonylcarbamoyladenosine(37)-N6)-methyltransferase TrmO [Pseudomonadota bacterium]